MRLSAVRMGARPRAVSGGSALAETAETTVRFFDALEIRQTLTFPSLIAAIEAAHRRPKIDIQDGMMGQESAHYFVRHAVDAGRLMGSKLITSFPQNLSGGARPAVQAVCVIFDGRDGRPLAIMDGTEITYWRTAGDSALGSKFLARPDARTLLVVGAGGMARRLIQAHRAVRPTLEHILLWNRTQDRAERVAVELANEGVAVQVVHELRRAVQAADIISTCTRAHRPLIFGADLQPGSHLDLVGGYTRDTREADDEAARRARVFVDRRETAFHVGDIVEPIANGVIERGYVLGDLYDLVAGSVEGRRSPRDITFYKNAGGGHLDLMTADFILTRCGLIGPPPPEPEPHRAQ